MEDNSYLREILEQRGWYKRWYTQVMADILMPHVTQLAEPEKNAVLNRFKEEENNMLALYMVKEFMKNVGLPSTGKIFEAEAGLFGLEQDFQPIILEQFSLLKSSTPEEIQPPLLSQALHIWKVEAQERQQAEQQSAEINSYSSSVGMKTPSIINRIMRSDSCLVSSDTAGSYDASNITSTLDSSAAAATNNEASGAYRHYSVGGGGQNGNGSHSHNHSHMHVNNGNASHPDPLAGLTCRRNNNNSNGIHRSMNCKRCS